MKALLISIKPKWVEKIVNSEKTIEVRKSRPKIDTPFKCYIYCTKDRKNLLPIEHGKVLDKVDFWKNIDAYYGFGKVIGEFVCDRIEEIYPLDDDNPIREELKKQTCMSCHEMVICLSGRYQICGYGWHISELKIYDKPKKLREFYRPLKYNGDGVICGTENEMNNIYEWDCETLFKDKYPNFKFENCECKNCPKAKDFYRLTRPPQSWCYVEEL